MVVPDGSAPGSARELRRYWLERAFAGAGIDAAHWDPDRGVEANRRTIACVYDYYGRLYLQHPRLQWAGMANLIGPSFYAGFLDIGAIPDAGRRVLAWLRRFVAAARRTDAVIVVGLGFFEGMFLLMQRKIFEDQALMHEAYLGGGLDAIRVLGSAGLIDETTVRAWEQIDGVDAAGVEEGNRTLLYREQHDIIDRFYVEMRAYAPPQGRLFTYLLTLAGSPAVPGAEGYTAVFPLTLAARLPGGSLTLRTPLADGDIAAFANRWALISENTLPAYLRLIRNETARARALVGTPIERRVPRFRLVRRLGAIAVALLTHWRVRFRRGPRVSRRLGVEHTTPARVEPGAEVTIDLTSRPTRARVWSTSRPPFPITVRLPGGRTFSNAAALAVLLGPAPQAGPTRLTIKLPATDHGGARATLTQLAREWNADRDEVERWAAAAAEVSLDEHAYATRVFRAQSLDFVRLEFQVEHHVDSREYVVDALFSWDRAGPRIV